MKHRARCHAVSVGAALLAGLFAVTALVQAAELTSQEKALIPLAKKEGAVTIIIVQTIVLLVSVVVFRRLAGREALTA